MNKPLTIKSLLALSLATLISLFSLQSFAGEPDQHNATDVEQVKIKDDSMLPDEEMVDEKTVPETEEGEEPETGKPLSQSDEADIQDEDEDTVDQPKASPLMLG